MRIEAICFAVLLLIMPATLPAQTSTNTQTAAADTFVSSGQPDSNFGTLGAMEIAAPTTAQPRTQETLLLFDTSALQSGFDSQFGAGNWIVTSVSLKLFSNVATAGQQPSNNSFNKIAAGNFELDLLSNNNWNETTITWNTLPTILPGTGNTNTLTPLGTFLWPATGSPSSTWTLNPDPALLSAIASGSDITIFGQPTSGSTVGYLYNTRLTNPAQLNVTAQAVPEPSFPVSVVAVSCFLLALRATNSRSQTIRQNWRWV
ncbi:MAG: hypothetical protein C5B50_29405 [Verrucomicrobia bacterium]|nr:MAG: hypothetical protein C5B50_29405 [Verrucomicrobiota bacterium]